MILAPTLDWRSLQNEPNRCFLSQASPPGTGVDTLVIQIKPLASLPSPRWRAYLRGIEAFASVLTTFSADMVVGVPAGAAIINRAIASARDDVVVAASGVPSPVFMGLEISYNSTVAPLGAGTGASFRAAIAAGQARPLWPYEWIMSFSAVQAGNSFIVQPGGNGVLYNCMWAEFP